MEAKGKKQPRTVFEKGTQFLGSALWASLNYLSARAVQRRWVKPVRLPSRVISIGNLQAGGTGKTPLVSYLAQEAIQAQKSVCILSRGYRSLWEAGGGVIAPGVEPVEPELCGDEPALLHELVPQAWIGIGRNRHKSYQTATQMYGKPFDWVILDDGFQNHQLEKDVEIVLVTSKRWGEAWFREYRSALQRADLVVWTKGGEVLASEFQVPKDKQVQVQTKLSFYKASQARRDAPYLLVSGVGDPIFLQRQLRESGYDLRDVLTFPDHARYIRSDLEKVRQKSNQGNLRILMTGKDWVKWKRLGLKEEDVTIVDLEIELVSGKENWERLLWEK